MTDNFILGLDLDGVVADFYKTIRPLAAKWFGTKVADLTEAPTHGLPEWGFDSEGLQYEKFHRWAVTQADLFNSLAVVPGAAPAIRRLSDDKVRIRIVTNRLYISHFHEPAVTQTVRWLDRHGIPYWDLCLMPDKHAVQADVYVEDSPSNIVALDEAGCDVIIFENSTNRDMELPGDRAKGWAEAEAIIRGRMSSRPTDGTALSREQLVERLPED